MTTKLINGDCLEEMKKLENNSIDLLFTDLPYTTAKTKCTSCSWDKPIDLEKFWIEVNRICKINCPMFFCCNTRFGVELINSNPKNFRYDFIWQKSRKVGFLNSGKMPLRSHELIFVFYRKQPVYNVKKYHKHKFLKESNSIIDTKNEDKNLGNVFYGFDKNKFIDMRKQTGYEPPLPDSIIKETRNDDGCESLYANEKGKKHRFKIDGKIRDAEPRYEPPLPDSIIKETRNDEYDNREIKQRNTLKNEENYGKSYLKKKENFRAYNPKLGAKGEESSIYEPPLPDSLLEIKSVGGKHQTQKPVDLINFFIKYYSNEGDTILDPTMGSGSTGLACKELNRNFIGIELDEKIFKVAEERIGLSSKTSSISPLCKSS